MAEQHDIFGLTHQGMVRERNEDHFLVARLGRSAELLQTSLDDLGRFADLGESTAYLLLVADGVGGSDQGRLASGTAVEVLAEQIAETANCYYALDVDAEHELIEQLEVAVGNAHQKIIERRGDTASAATTLTMTTLLWPRAYTIHLGDSRGYYLRDEQLRRFTQDQTMEEALLDSGTLQEDSPLRKRYRNVITRAVGGGDATPAVGLVDLSAGDVLLLCTDGLTRHVDDDELARILGRDNSAEEIAGELLEAALAGGGHDNITVIVGRMGVD